MPKKIISKDALLDWINAELTKYEQCKDCCITSINLTQEDAEFCNWSVSVLRGSGVPTELCLPFAKDVIQHARAQFNIEG